MSEIENNILSNQSEQLASDDTTAPLENTSEKDKTPSEEIPFEPIEANYEPVFNSSESLKKPIDLLSLIAKPLAVIAAVIVIILLARLMFSSGDKKDEVNLFTDGMLTFIEKDAENYNSMYGIINQKGDTIADADYVSVILPGEDIIIATEFDSESVASYSTKLLNKKGDEITEFEFDNTDLMFSDGLLAAATDDRWGYVNTKGKWVIDAKYDGAHAFSESLAGVKDHKKLKWGFINKKGEKVIGFKFDDVGSFSDGLAPAKKDDKWGFINEKGDWEIKNSFMDVGEFSDGIALAKDTNDKWGYINKKGEWVIDAKFQELKRFSEGLAAAKKNGKWGYINKKGKWIIDNEYALAGDFLDGLAYVQENPGDKFGYINQKGDYKIKPQFDMASSFINDIALINNSGKYGYINKKGKLVIENDYKSASTFYDDGYAVVCTGDADSSENDEWFVINKKGKPIFDKTFDGIY